MVIEPWREPINITTRGLLICHTNVMTLKV